MERHTLHKGGVLGCPSRPDPLAALKAHYAARMETQPGELVRAVQAELGGLV